MDGFDLMHKGESIRSVVVYDRFEMILKGGLLPPFWVFSISTTEVDLMHKGD